MTIVITLLALDLGLFHRFVADSAGWEKFPATVSPGLTLALITGGILYSLWRTQREEPLKS